MDLPSNYYTQPTEKRKSARAGKVSTKPPLFDDTSVQKHPQQTAVWPPQTSYIEPGSQPFGVASMPNQGWSQQFPGQQIFNDPMANMAMQYGSSLAGQGKDLVNKNLEKYVSTSKLKYYFAVDTSYVGKKLLMLFFPFATTASALAALLVLPFIQSVTTIGKVVYGIGLYESKPSFRIFTHISRKDWSVKFDQDQPVAPRYDEHAPDLYIPVMGFVTYVLVAGIVLGTQNRFTPEQLGIQASTALVWLIIELMAIMLSLYIINLSSQLKYLDVLSYTGYKFVGMIFSLLGGMLFQGRGYYVVLAWFSFAIVFFLVRSLRVHIIPHSDQSHGYSGTGTKRSLYLILCISVLQPILMWWLTRHIVFAN